jgi:CRP-like cAMP-binding protein
MFEQYRDTFPYLKDTWEKYTSLWERMEVPARHLLLKEGDISRRAFLVEKGCLRVWFNSNGKDVTFQFFFENGVVSSVESFRKNVPSLFSIETIEPSVVYVLRKKDYDAMMNELSDIPAVKDYLLDAVFERQFHYMRQFLSFIRDTPTQRYLNLIKEQPQIVQRVPQHYIASYLGITPVSLSRIRNKIRLKEHGSSS